MTAPQFIDKNSELEVVGEFNLCFYRPIGKITKNIDNIYFQFSDVEKTNGYIEYNALDLSNIDLNTEIGNINDFLLSIKSSEVKYKYIEKLDLLKQFIENNTNHLLYPHIIRAAITQFYNIELLGIETKEERE